MKRCNCEACKKYSKTRLVEKYAKKHKIKIKRIKLSKVTLGDFLGMPVGQGKSELIKEYFKKHKIKKNKYISPEEGSVLDLPGMSKKKRK